MTVYFGVKYYASDPCKLAEEITRYQFFLQCKQDILNSRLPISFELAVELFALAVQSELGDFDPQRHHDGYVSEFQFLPQQSAELEKRVAMFHRNLIGQVPATAELNFLERVKWLDLYGCELHPIQYEDNSEAYALGLNPGGVLVLRNKLKVAHYLWPRIVKAKCQGRCFLMDVIENSKQQSTGGGGRSTNRFGFRLADKFASRRLRQAIEEHKSFYHLVHNSATLNQLAHRHQRHQQQQQMKFSQRFRNSIRSAMPFNSQQQQQQHMLRSSVKSLGNQHQQQQAAAAAMMQYALADRRQQPTVVRMPSRRYSNRSMTRNFVAPSAANGSGLPTQMAGAGGAHTMIDSQRQQAIMMMNQFNQMNGLIGKSQTLKPMPASGKFDSKEAKKNPYYHQMMMMMAASAAANQHLHPDVAVLPPGQHIVQPSIYKASSVVNGINQLGGAGAQPATTAMMQFFNTRPQYPTHRANGRESPRSTKSAIAPSSALKLAAKKLAKQQLIYDNQVTNDAQPLLAYDPINQQQQMYSLGYGHNMSTSANPSPRSMRSDRLTNSRHKSKSTNENLNLLQQQTSNNNNSVKYPNLIQPSALKQSANGMKPNKMLLATTAQMMQANGSLPPPPPGYNSSVGMGPPRSGAAKMSARQLQLSDNESDASKRSMALAATMAGSKKRATFALDNDQAALLFNGLLMDQGSERQQQQQQFARRQPSDGEDDYCCSRSDCSSIDDGSRGKQISNQLSRRNRRLSSSSQQQQEHNHQQAYSRRPAPIVDQLEWNAIKRRHNEFLMNGCFGNNNKQEQNHPCSPTKDNARSMQTANHDQYDQQQQENHLVKNIANKQATPILLSMNYDQTNANNKAIQLLNLQRQQLNSSSSDGGNKSSSSALDSAPSSVASSPQAPSGNNSGQGKMSGNRTTADSTASNSTTSGYYAGSNSTGSASVDSDSQTQTEARAKGTKGPYSLEQEGSRAKIALGSYSARIASQTSGRIFNQNHQSNKPQNTTSGEQRQQQQANNQRQFYLGETLNNDDNNNIDNDCRGDNQTPQSITDMSQQQRQQWSPLNQIQQHAPSSLKYVSFDV